MCKLAKKVSKAYAALGSDLLPMCRYPAFAGLYSRVVGEQAKIDPQLSADKGKFIELKKIQYIYGMYAAAQGNGEGALTIAEGLFNFGDWSAEGRNATYQQAIEWVDKAIAAAQRDGDKDLLKKISLLKFDILMKEFKELKGEDPLDGAALGRVVLKLGALKEEYLKLLHPVKTDPLLTGYYRAIASLPKKLYEEPQPPPQADVATPEVSRFFTRVMRLLSRFVRAADAHPPEEIEMQSVGTKRGRWGKKP